MFQELPFVLGIFYKCMYVYSNYKYTLSSVQVPNTFYKCFRDGYYYRGI